MPVVLNAKKRSSFSNSDRREIREKGHIPAIIYGKDLGSKAVSVDSVLLMKTLREEGRNAVLNVTVDGDKHPVMVQEIQKDPIKDEIIHADFHVVNMETEVDVEVNIQLKGESQGVKDGGFLQQPLHQIKLRAKPGHIPSSIEVDISSLGVNETIHVKDIQTNGQFEILDGPEEVVVTILPPKQEEEIDSGEEQETGVPEAEEGRENQE